MSNFSQKSQVIIESFQKDRGELPVQESQELVEFKSLMKDYIRYKIANEHYGQLDEQGWPRAIYDFGKDYVVKPGWNWMKNEFKAANDLIGLGHAAEVTKKVDGAAETATKPRVKLNTETGALEPVTPPKTTPNETDALSLLQHSNMTQKEIRQMARKLGSSPEFMNQAVKDRIEKEAREYAEQLAARGQMGSALQDLRDRAHTMGGFGKAALKAGEFVINPIPTVIGKTTPGKWIYGDPAKSGWKRRLAGSGAATALGVAGADLAVPDGGIAKALTNIGTDPGDLTPAQAAEQSWNRIKNVGTFTVPLGVPAKAIEWGTGYNPMELIGLAAEAGTRRWRDALNIGNVGAELGRMGRNIDQGAAEALRTGVHDPSPRSDEPTSSATQPARTPSRTIPTRDEYMRLVRERGGTATDDDYQAFLRRQGQGG